MRSGEPAGLRWSDIDLDRRILTVGHAVQMRGSRGHHVDVLKTSASHRTIGLPAAAVGVLRDQQRRQAAHYAGRTPRPTNDLVFPSRRGTVLEPSNVRRELERICAKSGVPRITPNELRHTCATLLNYEGVPLELIADMLGTPPRRCCSGATGIGSGRQLTRLWARWIASSAIHSVSPPPLTRGPG